MLTNQSALSEYLNIQQQFQHVHQDRNIFLKELQEKFPCDQRPLRKYSWSILEATLIYYGLDPWEISSTLDRFALIELLHIIDFQRIQELFSNHIGHSVCPAQDSVLASKFVSFLQEKQVPIPQHLLCLSPDSLTIKKTEGSQDETVSDEDEDTKKSKTRVYDPLVLRKEAIINKAKIFWFKERREIRAGNRKEYTKSHQLIRKKEMVQLAIDLNVELFLPPLSIKNDPAAQNEFNSVKNDTTALRKYLENFKNKPEFLIDVDWISPYYRGD